MKELIEKLNEHNRNTPEKIALVYNNQQLDYKTLETISNQVCDYIIKNSKHDKNENVLLITEKNLYSIAIILGIIKSGKIYTPISIKDSFSYINSKISQLNPCLVITDIENIICDSKVSTSNLIDELVNYDSKCIDYSNNCSYCIQTSGTSGQSKSVFISSLSILNHTKWMNNQFDFSPNDIFLHRTDLAFDASIWEIFNPIYIGAKIVILDSEQAMLPISIIMSIVKNKVTIAQFTPSILNEVISNRYFDKCTCRIVFSGGDSLTNGTVQSFYNKSSAQLVNLYGPAECTIDSSFYIVDRKKYYDDIPIGNPISNVKFLVLNDDSSPSNFGELYISGDGVFSGYNNLNSKEICSEINGLKYYRTGDIVSVRDGLYYYEGRNDEQVKINGIRINILSIQNVISEISYINECKLIYLKDINKLVSAISFKEDGTLDRLSSELSSRVRHSLIPSYFKLYDNIPKLKNGKLDINKIKFEIYDEINNYNMNFNCHESKFKHIFDKYINQLGYFNIKQNMKWFDIGMNSLDLVRFINLISNELNINIPLSFFYKNPIVSDVMFLIENESITYKIKKCNSSYVMNAPGNSQIEILNKPNFIPKNSENMVFPFLVKCEVDIEKIKDSMIKVYENYDVFNMAFYFNYTIGCWELVESEIKKPHIEIIDVPACQTLEMLQFIYERECKFIHNLESGGLLRLILLRTEYGTYMIFNTHHIICDGWSFDILIKSFCAIYNGGVIKSASKYNDYIKDLSYSIENGFLLKEITYWKDKIGKLKMPSDFSCDLDRPAKFSFNTSSTSRSINIDNIDGLCLKFGVTQFTLILTSYIYALSKIFDLDDIYIRSPYSNRDYKNSENSIGYYILPMIIKPDFSNCGLNFRNILQAVKADVEESLENCIIPTDIIESFLKKDTKSYYSRFPFWYNHHNYLDSSYFLSDNELSPLDLGNQEIKTDISLNTYVLNGFLNIKMSIYSDAYEVSTANFLLEEIVCILNDEIDKVKYEINV
ncbi:AMP-binding protein [Aliivibrio fischeri]|uniref:AMP-binding protein n=1 Tax=Aliivibrio fischeri TaxID=668 RepID=UPI001F1B920E|nr:AMP-binding protein [Aliivibrio fischeri]MCE7534919.1 AMP-binding protein [Aliivibrio fischeri]MCE7559361.1 AMP-binding protein [Aliivibrio fischeri]